MNRMISAGILLLAAGLGQLQTISPAQSSRQDWYKMAMSGWENSAKVSISPKARDAIAYSFEQHKGELADFGGDRVWKDSDRTLKQTLLIYYLGDLRDGKTLSESGTYPAAMPVNQNPTGTKDRAAAGRMGGFVIETSDVEAYPVKKFLDRIQPVLKGYNGELHVVSQPTGAAITLDNASRGYTEKITVESAGDHQIIVSNKKTSMRCEDKVNVPAGGSVTFHCP